MRILKVSQHITDDKKFPLHMEFGNVRAHFIDLMSTYGQSTKCFYKEK